MKPPPFDYHVAETLEEACALKQEHGADARVLAGGQSLIPLMSSRRLTPRVLIDIKRIPGLQDHRRDNGTLVIGAALRQSRLHDDREIVSTLPLLGEAARHIGHLEIRHRGTVGGNLAHADPISELPAAAVAIGAEIVARGADGERRIPADEFFAGPRTTTLGDDEVVAEIRYPVLPAGAGWGFAEIARRQGDPAMATAVAILELDDEGGVASASVTVGAVGARPQRAEAVEAALRGETATDDRITEAAMAAADLVEPEPEPPDTGPTPHPPAIPLGYRRRLAAAVTAQALTQALERANGKDRT